MAILKNPAAACTPPSPHSRSRRSGVAANRRERATTNNQKSKNLKTGNMSSIVFGYRRNAGAKGTRSRFTVTQTTRVRRRSAAGQRSPATRPNAEWRLQLYQYHSCTLWRLGCGQRQRAAASAGARTVGGRSSELQQSGPARSRRGHSNGRGLVSRVTVSVIGVGVSATHLVAHLYT